MPISSKHHTQTSRRVMIGSLPLAVAAAAMPGITLGQVAQDKKLIAACNEVVTLEHYIWNDLKREFPGQESSREIDNLYIAAREPLEAQQTDALMRVIELPATTIEGIRAKARATLAWSNGIFDEPGVDYDHQLVASLLRDLAGG